MNLCSTQQRGIAQTVDDYAFRFIVFITYGDPYFRQLRKVSTYLISLTYLCPKVKRNFRACTAFSIFFAFRGGSDHDFFLFLGTVLDKSLLFVVLFNMYGWVLKVFKCLNDLII